MNYWLMKTEPEEFSWDDLVKRGAKGEPWTGVRNFTARGYLKDMKKGVATGVHTGSANPDSTEVPTGTGQTDYRAILSAAKEVGVERYYLEDETARPFETVPLSIRWLEAVQF